MEKMAVKWTIIQMIVIAIASSFVNFRFALGIVLGGIFSLIHFFVLSKNVSSILNNEKTSTAKVGFLLIRMLINGTMNVRMCNAYTERNWKNEQIL